MPGRFKTPAGVCKSTKKAPQPLYVECPAPSRTEPHSDLKVCIWGAVSILASKCLPTYPPVFLSTPGELSDDFMRVRQLRSRSTTSETHRDVSSAAAMVIFPIFHPAATTPTAAQTTLAHPQTNQQNSTRVQEWYDSYNSPAGERFKARN